MGGKFEELTSLGEKVGEPLANLSVQLATMQSMEEDTSCSTEEEGQSPASKDKRGLVDGEEGSSENDV